ncbi:hypothetical protein A3860_32920 [Niastella vici]|uniref:Uncharacterized protein n=1 Tax=Niastella vici TaxID=1703345 RepID=A0A1V9FQL8_9BACT|nr:hypothetical protein A3860_32920 [Niastella vici]
MISGSRYGGKFYIKRYNINLGYEHLKIGSPLYDYISLGEIHFQIEMVRKIKKRPNPLCRNHTLTMSYSALLFKRSDFYLYKNLQKN